MNQFLAFIKKEFFHIYRDKRAILILLVMPIAQILLFGFAISTDVKNIKTAILAPKHTEMMERLAEEIDQNPRFDFVGFLQTENEIDNYLRTNKADVTITFPANFENEVYSGLDNRVCISVNATDPNTASIESNYIAQELYNILSEKTMKGIEPQASPINVRLMYNPQMKSSFNFVPGIMGLIMILICAMMTSVSIVREKESGTMEVLLASPMKPFSIMIAKMVPYFGLACINLISILLLAYFVLDVPLTGSFFWIVALSLLYIILALSLGLLISTLAETQIAAMLISAIVLMMPVILLSGMIFPSESMPPILEYISKIIPTRWYISAMRKLMIQGVSIEYVLKEVYILLGMTAFIIAITIKKFKIRLE
ncbi:MAG TPA: ABC transporter permease [Paludibacteraceae bacterium]|nr:ABC transporter permease [Paludibacteraceae bacterium]HQF50358.1 ABC transporter permease [Paludibacteraceae bacterium]HQJ89234.1 ABC transporter permease [Paludibacteraceae bacterium]